MSDSKIAKNKSVLLEAAKQELANNDLVKQIKITYTLEKPKTSKTQTQNDK